MTPFGASLGLTNADVNGNFSHNYFASTGGMNIVDLFNNQASKPLTLAFRGQISAQGTVPEPGAMLIWLVLVAAGMVVARRRRR